jgi:hypothetical protein
MAVFAGAGVYYVMRNGDFLKKTLLDNLNPYLTVPVNVSSVDVTIFRTFPAVSVILSEVVIPASPPFDANDTLLAAKRIFFKFNLFDLYAGKYDFRRINIEQGRINIHIDKNGKGNFDVILTTDIVSSTSPMLKLSEVELTDISFCYEDARSAFKIAGDIASLKADGRFEKSQLDLFLQTGIELPEVSYKLQPYFSAKSLRFRTAIAFDTEQNIFFMSNGHFNLEERLSAEVSGRIEPNVYEINFTAPDFQIAEAMVLLPDAWKKPFEKSKPEGRCRGVAALRGETGKIASVVAGIELENGAFTYDQATERLNLDRLKISYKAGPGFKQGGELNLDTAVIRTKYGMATGKINLTNLQKPLVQLIVNGAMEAKDLKKFISYTTFELLEGSINFKAQYTAVLPHLDSIRRPEVHLKGWNISMVWKEGALAWKSPSYEITDIQLALQLRDADLHISRLSARRDSTTVYFWGDLKNSIPMVLSQEQGMLTGELKVDYLNIKDWLLPSGHTAGDSLQEWELHTELYTEIEHLQYADFDAKFVEGNIKYRKGMWQANPIIAQISKGELRGKMSFGQVDKGYRLNTYTEIRDVDISALFKAFNNFGQKELTWRQIRGTAEVAAHSEIYFDNKLSIMPQSVNMQADVRIMNGRLFEYHSLQAISNYFGKNAVLRKLFKAQLLEEKLKDVQFKELRNHIEIKKGKVIIPEMLLSSNIIDINISGIHGFDLKYKYRFDLDISALMVDRRPEDTEDGEIVDDGTGRLRVFLLMEGDANDFNISLDKAARKSYKTGRKKEKARDLKGALREEFGFFGSDTSLTRTRKSSTEFEIEWPETTLPKQEKDTSLDDAPTKKKGGLFKRIRESEREEDFLEPGEL